MAESELDALRRKKLQELQRQLAEKQNRENATQTKSGDDILNRIFKDRAWEVFNTASYQFPQAMSKIKALLLKLAASGQLEDVTGEQLYHFLRSIGLKVRLNTKISIQSHGQLKSIAEKMKEDLRPT